MRVAHFSDVHLLSLQGVRWRDFANKRWIGGLNLIGSRGRHHRADIFDALVDDLNRAGVDHVVCTGDLTNVAYPDEFRFARERFDRLALGPAHVTVVPGNHDAYVAAGAPHFERHFADHYAADEAFRWPDGEVWPTVRVRGPIAVIGLSTCRTTPWFTAYGVLGDTQLARLRAVLADPRLDGLLRVVAIHHPPAGAPARSRVRGLRDRDGFAAVLAEVGAELVLHGHEHRDLRTELAGPDGPVPVHGIQSGSYESGNPAKRARYRVYEIASGAGRPRVAAASLRVWSPEAGAFVADPAGTAQPLELATA